MLTKFKPTCWHLPRPSSDYPGCYPKYFEKRFLKFAQIESKRVLHLFSGKSKMGFRVDLKLENKPDVVADCHNLPFRDNLDFDAVLADPPYDNEYAERLYSTPKLKQRKYLDTTFMCYNFSFFKSITTAYQTVIILMFIIKDVMFSGVLTFGTFFQLTSLLHISYISNNKYRLYHEHAFA